MTPYVEVPPEPWLPEQLEGCTHSVRRSPSPFREGGGGGEGSLVQYKGLTDTIQKPSEICLHALEKFEQLKYNDDRKQYDNIVNRFYEYLEDCDKKGFVLRGWDTKEGKFKVSHLDYDNRWSPRCRRELSRKLNNLEAWFTMQLDRPVTMITLTSFHEGLTIPAAWFNLNQSRTKLLKLIRKYFGDVDYFWVVEPHKSGYVHYHLAVFADVSNNVKDNKGKGIEDKFRDIWSKKYKTGNHTYGLDFSQKKDKTKLDSLREYLSKYLRKSFLMDEWSIGMLLFNAHLWDTGFRAYGASKRISAIMKLPEPKHKDVVWLETTYQDIQKTPDIIEHHGSMCGGDVVIKGEKIEVDRILWARQYIPDWIDTDIWYLGIEPDKSVKLCDWGRGPHSGYDPTHGKTANL